jgi:hypothetical protein
MLNGGNICYTNDHDLILVMNKLTISSSECNVFSDVFYN